MAEAIRLPIEVRAQPSNEGDPAGGRPPRDRGLSPFDPRAGARAWGPRRYVTYVLRRDAAPCSDVISALASLLGARTASRGVLIDVMQPAEHRPTDDLAGRVGYGRRRRPARHALTEPSMGSPGIEIGDVLSSTC
jgi:hypothetical protein